MARIRTFKPEFWRHPVIGRLPDDIQLLALSLLTMADDEGYFRADPLLIRGEVQPFREDLVRIQGGLTELSRIEWIELREHPIQGVIGHIRKWSDHQVINRPTNSKLKPYFITEDSVSTHGGLSAGKEGKGKERNRERNKEVRSLTLPSWLPIEEWNSFVEMRKLSRHPMSFHAKELIIKKLAEMHTVGVDLRLVLDQSTERGWLSVFPLGRNGHGNKRDQEFAAALERCRQDDRENEDLPIVQDRSNIGVPKSLQADAGRVRGAAGQPGNE